MNIVVITREEFPFGGAATNRMLTYLPGLVSKGHKVTVLCTFLSQKDNAKLLNERGECNYHGIQIKYVAGRKPWPIGTKQYLSKALLVLRKWLNMRRYLISHKHEIDVVQLYSADVCLYKRCSKICRQLGLKYTIERSELPDIVKHKEKFIHTRKGEAYIQRSEKAFGLFDGWILETQTLVDYYSQFFSSHARYAIIPMTVDVDRFSVPKKDHPDYGKYIAYCGNMSEVDGISILIKAYSLVHRKYPTIKLVLAGESADVPSQKRLVVSLGLHNDVVFLGRLSRNEVPQFLADATVLVLASPTSDRACATMPCKVGEYLCTANPVVVTGLGEINKYLKDGDSAFLSKPDSPEAFAAKLDEVLSDLPRAMEIGLRGKQVAIDNFGSEAQATRIEHFYKELIKD